MARQPPGRIPRSAPSSPDVDTGPQSAGGAARANVAAGGALNRPIRPATGQPGLQAGTYQPGQYSQDDIDRAKSLSGLSSLVSPGLAQKLAGAASVHVRIAFEPFVEQHQPERQSGAMPSSPSVEQYQFEQSVRRNAARRQHAVEHLVAILTSSSTRSGRTRARARARMKQTT